MQILDTAFKKETKEEKKKTTLLISAQSTDEFNDCANDPGETSHSLKTKPEGF